MVHILSKEGLLQHGQAVGYVSTNPGGELEVKPAVVNIVKNQRGNRFVALYNGLAITEGVEDQIQLSLGGSFSEMIKTYVEEREAELKIHMDEFTNNVKREFETNDPVSATLNAMAQISSRKSKK